MKYETAVPIGSGGMGEVYKAFDPVLKRWVALKYPRWDRPGLAERFLREARLQARVDHEGVCKVFEIGSDDGRAYIAMQYIEGSTLDAAAEGMTLREKVEVMRLVAEAVHAAHQTGLVHRDLKPHNIMIEKDGAVFRPYVMDFGLAREHAAEGLTRTGVVLGTPAYMAPEQALGHPAVDRRADVYSLGAVLYRLVAGRPPFDGAELDVILKVAHADAPSLRGLDPTVPADLDTIVMKCLEKEPARRYDSAGALAEDLGRHLAGEPIAGRPTGRVERLWRRVRRHRVAASAVAAATLVALAASGAALLTRRDAAQRAEAAQRFGEETERAEAILRQAYLLPLHDTRVETAAARRQMKAIEAEILVLGSAARGPGHAALGRGHLLLGEWEQARHQMEQAWAAGYRTPDAAVALGHALARLYEDALLDLERISDTPTREARRRQAEKSLRDPALLNLRGAAPSTTEPPAYVEALVAMCDRHYDQALARARESFQAVPWFYEAKLVEGDVHTLAAEEQRHAGEYAGAAARLRDAAAAYGQAAEVARSAPSVRARECRARVQQFELELERGADPSALLDPAAASCDRALQADPDGVAALSSYSRLYWRWADFRIDTTDEDRAVSRAIELGQRAVALDAANVDARVNLAWAFSGQGEREKRHARSPVDSYHASIEQFQAAARLQPDNPRALLGQGTMLNTLARYEAERGKDPRQALKGAIAALEKAAELMPSDAPRNNLGNTYLSQAEYEATRGIDPGPSYAQALRWYDEGLRVNPRSYYEYVGRGLALVSQGLFFLTRGQDPAPLAAQAEEGFRKALELKPGLATAEANLGRVEMLRADALSPRGGDPRPGLRRARDAFQKALAINPQFSPAAVSLATSYHAEGDYLLREAHDPGPAVREGLAWVKRARGIDGDPDDTDLWEARLWLLSARWALRARAGVEGSLDRAEERLQALVQRRPAGAEVQRTLAEVSRLRAEWELARRRPAEARQAVASGLARTEAALAANPSDPESFAERGALLSVQAALAEAADARAQAAAAARGAYDRALQLNPLLAARYPDARR